MLAGELSSVEGKQTIVLMTPIMSRKMLGAFVIMCAKINIWVRDKWRCSKDEFECPPGSAGLPLGSPEWMFGPVLQVRLNLGRNSSGLLLFVLFFFFVQV